MKQTKMTRIIEGGFWLTLFAIMTYYDLQFFSFEQAALASLTRVGTFMGIAYLNIYFLIPRFFNRKGFIWYALSIILLILLVRFTVYQVAPANPRGFVVEIKRLTPEGEEILIQRNPKQLAFAFGLMTVFSILFISSSYRLGIDFLQKERNAFLLEKEKMASEMKFLRMQINPHFFFNALNNLYALSRINPSKTGEFISRLSDMLRYVIYDCNQSTVALEKEITYLENYLYFQEIKEDEGLSIQLDSQIKNPSYQIEPMLFLPIVENAFKHGYSPSNEKTEITIKVQQDDNSLIFSCMNNLPKSGVISRPDPSYSGIGIKNIRARLDYSYPDQHHLQIKNDGHYFEVTLTLQHEIKH